MITQLSFFSLLAFFVGIGILSFYSSRKTSEDYYLASRTMHPALVGISMGASSMSGFTFTGMIGFIYTFGVSGLWFMFGSLTGTAIGYCLTARSVYRLSVRNGFLSYGELIAGATGVYYRKLHVVAGLVILVALSLYAAAQLTAGSKALYTLFDWNHAAGIYIGAGIVFVYCIAGGIRASIWTDIPQALLMLIAMGIMAYAGLSRVGGLGQLWLSLREVDPNLISVLPVDTAFGPLLFIVGWVTNGVAFIGWPHSMVRLMTLKDPRRFSSVFMYYYSWKVAFFVAIAFAALSARVLLPDVSAFDSEIALPLLSQKLLPEVLVGVILAGIFASSISTADSQILCCSAAITRDLFPGVETVRRGHKLSTLAVVFGVVGIALYGGKEVFSLVLLAVSILGSSFVPLLLLYSFDKKVSEFVAIGMIVVGISVVIGWRYAGYHKGMYELVPSFIASFLFYYLAYVIGKISHPHTTNDDCNGNPQSVVNR